MDKSDLGFWIGPICVGVDAMADDLYLLSDSQVGLQELLNLAQHYGRRYRCVYGAAKTKIVVTGSNIDMSYFKDVQPWTMDGTTVEVVENNEHLGLVVSGEREAEKNVDLRHSSPKFRHRGQVMDICLDQIRMSPTPSPIFVLMSLYLYYISTELLPIRLCS